MATSVIIFHHDYFSASPHSDHHQEIIRVPPTGWVASWQRVHTKQISPGTQVFRRVCHENHHQNVKYFFQKWMKYDIGIRMVIMEILTCAGAIENASAASWPCTMKPVTSGERKILLTWTNSSNKSSPHSSHDHLPHHRISNDPHPRPILTKDLRSHMLGCFIFLGLALVFFVDHTSSSRFNFAKSTLWHQAIVTNSWERL